MSFKSVLLGTSANKNYTHNMSFDNNTTMDFGFLQPLLSQYMLPKSTISVNSKQLVRLAPMPTPSFARMYLQNYARFVKMTDVVPYYESLLSGISFTTPSGVSVKPTQVPVTTNSFLMWNVLYLSACSVFKKVPRTSDSLEEWTLRIVTGKDDVGVFSNYLNIHFGFSSRILSNFFLDFITDNDNVVKPLQADYIVELMGDDGQTYLYCFLFSARAKRLRKQLIGLGYSLNGEDNKPVSIAPLLAYYKAYYDYFGLTREIQFEQTNCFKIIGFVWEYNVKFYQLEDGLANSFMLIFVLFLRDFTNLYYTDASSYIAAHRADPMNKASYPNVNTSVFSLSQYSSSNNPDYIKQNQFSVPQLNGDPALPTWLSIDLLRRLSRFVSKDSVIGKRLSDWVKVHYGSDVSFDLFKDSFNISEWRTPIDIDDVFSTSETANVGNKGKGDFLGAYAGKGIGFGKGGFTFKAPTHGFVFVMSCIVPITNIFQGNDPTLYAIDNDTIPRPEFDALGYEFTPKGVFLSDNFLFSSEDLGLTSKGFGWVPRYTGFKVKKNIVNGDMYCGYFKRDLLPYFNDRLILSHSGNYEEIKDEQGNVKDNFLFSIIRNSVPSASTSWQQICKYGFLSNYNRLFYNVKSDSDLPFNHFDVFSYSDYGIFDNFICQTVFDVKVKNWLKPVQNSYDTVDEVDNSTISQSTN